MTHTANTFLVQVTGNLAQGRGKNVYAAQELCDSVGMVECEVYIWKDRRKIPSTLPLRNENLPVFAQYRRDKTGRETFTCEDC